VVYLQPFDAAFVHRARRIAVTGERYKTSVLLPLLLPFE